MPKAIFCENDSFKEIAKLASIVETQQLHCQFIDVKFVTQSSKNIFLVNKNKPLSR